jgi:hypothetical protein
MLKQRNQTRKLTLDRQTVRSLSAFDLTEINGGLPSTNTSTSITGSVCDSRCAGCWMPK